MSAARWTAKDLENLKKRNIKVQSSKKTKTSSTKGNKEKHHIFLMLNILKKKGLIPEFCEELRFSNERMFRFDWAIPELKIGIEYEGLMSQKSGHTTVTGYTKDCEKYNLAQIEGWIVLRYTALNHEEIYNDLNKIISKK